MWAFVRLRQPLTASTRLASSYLFTSPCVRTTTTISDEYVRVRVYARVCVCAALEADSTLSAASCDTKAMEHLAAALPRAANMGLHTTEHDHGMIGIRVGWC